MDEYLWTLVFLALVCGLAAALVFIPGLLGPKRPRPIKQELYECGKPLFTDARVPFQVRFYLVAMIFILFDVELLFLIPWAVAFRSLGVQGLAAMGIFVGVLATGLLYVWKEGVLEFDT